MKGLNSGDAYSYAVEAKDPDNDMLSYSLQGAPAGMTLTSQTVDWIPGNDAAGTHNFKIKVRDGKGGTASQNVSVTVCSPPKTWYSPHGMCM